MDPQLPTFLLIGAMKSGTTALARFLSGHPEVWCPKRKEPNYFTVEPIFGKSGTWGEGLDRYRERFEPGRDVRQRGDASTPYSMATLGGTGPDDGTARPERIRALLPDVKLLYLLRDPISRIESQYAHLLHLWQLEGEPIDEAVRRYPHFLDISRYAFQIGNYLEVFPREQVLLLQFEEMRRDPGPMVRSIWDFLGVDSDVEVDGLGEVHNERRTGGYPTRRSAAVAIARLRSSGLTRFVPMAARSRLRARISREAEPEEFRLAPETRAWVWEQLADDLAALEGLGAGWMVDEWRQLEAERDR